MTSPTQADMKPIVEELVRVWTTSDPPHYHPTCTSVFDINSGPCEIFADELLELVRERWPDADVEVCDFEDYLQAHGMTSCDIHYYLRVAHTYYDASSPEGVLSPECLSTNRGIWKQAERDLEESEDEDPDHDFEEGQDDEPPYPAPSP